MHEDHRESAGGNSLTHASCTPKVHHIMLVFCFFFLALCNVNENVLATLSRFSTLKQWGELMTLMMNSKNTKIIPQNPNPNPYKSNRFLQCQWCSKLTLCIYIYPCVVLSPLFLPSVLRHRPRTGCQFFARAIIKTDEPLFRLTFKLTDHFELCHGGWFFKSFLACGKKGRNFNSQKKEQSVFCAVRPSVKLCNVNCEPWFL